MDHVSPGEPTTKHPLDIRGSDLSGDSSTTLHLKPTESLFAKGQQQTFAIISATACTHMGVTKW